MAVSPQAPINAGGHGDSPRPAVGDRVVDAGGKFELVHGGGNVAGDTQRIRSGYSRVQQATRLAEARAARGLVRRKCKHSAENHELDNAETSDFQTVHAQNVTQIL